MVAWVPIVMAASAALNAMMQERSNQLNQSNYEDQKQFNLDAQAAQNRYNLPTLQRQRYEDAGINPYLAMSNITSGVQQSVMSAPQAPQNNPPQVDVGSMVNAITQYQVGSAQSALLKSQTENQKIKNQFEKEMNQVLIDRAKAAAKRDNAEGDFTSGWKSWLAHSQKDYIDSQRRFIDTQNDWFPTMQNGTLAHWQSIIGYNNAKADESKAQKGLIESNKKMVDFDLNFKKKWQEKIVKSEISKNYADAFASVYNAKTNRMNAITSRLSVDQQANYIAAQTMESYARYGKIKLDTWQSKKMFKYVRAQAIKDIKKRQSEIDNLNVNTKKTKVETGFIPMDHGFSYVKSINDMLNDDFKTLGKCRFLLK